MSNFLNPSPFRSGVENRNCHSPRAGDKEAPGQIMNTLTLSSALFWAEMGKMVGSRDGNQ